jgi:glutamate carboxypeptidase
MSRTVAVLVALVLVPTLAVAQVNDAVRAQAQRERGPFLDTLKELVVIESGSGDIDGITRIGTLIGQKLQALGGEVQRIPPPPTMTRFQSTPEKIGDTVVARFRGRGTKKILLLAHMDTVYQRGMLAQQPFRIDGDRAYGLGIADDKQGVAVILHTLAALRALNFNDYALITVLINPAEEVASVSARDLIATLGAEHDMVFSCEGGGNPDAPAIRLATSGAENAILTVKGRASHAGNAPEQGRNAFYELAHQVMQMRDLSDLSRGLKVNWTIASAGSVTNAIPADARAVADMRAIDPKDFDAVEARMRERIKNTLIPDTTTELRFERVFPPLPLREQSQRTAAYAQRVYGELGGTLQVRDTPTGGATDAAFAALRTGAPVVEGFGVQGFGAHSADAEYIVIPSIEPRLYLLARMIMDVSQGKISTGTN